MIDLHNHLLPGIDDGASDLNESLELARLFVDQGVTIAACTPHIYPGVYDNTGPDIMARVDALQKELQRAGIPLHLVAGADVHIAPDLVSKLRNGLVPSLHGSRYLLLEPPHHILPPRTDEIFFNLVSAGYVPILTHPERMSWIGRNYGMLAQLVNSGAWMQLTAGAVVGKFGREAQKWSERMLQQGLVHIVASDAHHPRSRPPCMREAFERLRELVGETEALNLVEVRPMAILANLRPSEVVPPRAPIAVPDSKPLWCRVAAYVRRS